MATKDNTTSIVRAPRPLRLRMATLQRVTPRRAAALAERLWFTVPKPPTTARLQRFTPDGAEPFYLMSGEAEIVGASYGPQDGPIAFLVHGWGGYWQQLSAHIPALVGAGYRVIVWDAPSHGRSTHGAEGLGAGSVLEMTAAVEAVAIEVGRPELVVAHSIGSMAALRATRNLGPAAAYVLIAPEVRLEPAIDWFAQVIDMGPRTREIFLDRVHRRIGLDMADFDVTADIARLEALGTRPSLLAIHDVDDPDTPSSETERLVADWPGAELVLTHHLGHRKVIWDAGTVAAVGAFAGRRSS